MDFEVTIRNVQHIKSLEFKTNLAIHGLTCLAGENGVGKTTLIRAIRNLSTHSTFVETAAPYIFNDESKISYQWGEFNFEFSFNKKLSIVDTKQYINEDVIDSIVVELALPHGERFHHFRRLSDLDEEIRSKIAIGDYSTPDDLIEFLHRVYQTTRFSKLKKVKIKNQEYYFVLRDEDERFYIREDYFSSGEYFVISLFKHIKKRKKLIVIDEIDISLDARAQVHLIESLREFCKDYEVNIVFTTHSLALMKTLLPGEIFYMEANQESGKTEIECRPYEFVKSVMYGFKDYGKYILTEDKRLAHYLHFLISNNESTVFHEYQIIHIAGASQVVDLIDRNESQNFFSSKENVLAVLDGDQQEERYVQGREDVLLLPFPSIEKAIYEKYLEGDEQLPRVDSIEGGSYRKKASNLFWKLTRVHANTQHRSPEWLYNYLEELKSEEVSTFRGSIIKFLNI